MNHFLKIILFISLISSISFGQLTGLSGWNIFLDPGHSQDENMGIYGYSEAKKNLRVGLGLRDFLLNNTDIDTVYMSRTNDQQSVSLSQRSDLANNVGAAWFHSIHSDAGAASSNSTLLMYGGWRSNGQTVEKTPHGGKAMADIMVDILTRGMRTTTRGNYADRTFYQGFPYNHTNQYPYLSVNRRTSMASELSEAGFHTNPGQNQRNMNAEWKRLEAYTFYWSILKFHGINRPNVGIANGIISDMDSNIPINGATITINGQSYTTDTYASLFSQYSSDPDQLHNGYYFIENLPNSTFDMYLEAPDYYSDTLQITMTDTFFTFKDARLISAVPPIITETTPANGDTNFSGYDRIFIEFSRSMNQASVENALSFSPTVTGTFFWMNSKEVRFTPDSLQFLTDYTITLAATAEDNYGHLLDGNGDGVGGDDFVMNFRTGPFDVFEPEIVAHYPIANQTNIELKPIVNILYDEELDCTSVADSLFDLASISNLQNSIPGYMEHRVINNQSMISFFPSIALDPLELYRTKVVPGFTDLLGNIVQSTEISVFTTTDSDLNITSIDNFESGSVTSNWWQPSQSGSTAGINPATLRSENTDYVNHLTGSAASMEINYDWNVSATSWLIREYLGGGTPRSVTFNNSYLLQVYIFGDGSGTKFRFAVDDDINGSPGHEVSTWKTIDWVGWQLVTWDMANDSVGTWLGNGVLTGTLRFDSIQLTYNPGTPTGTLYFDDLRLATKVPLGITDGDIDNLVPKHYQLFQNYPNPFNPSTTIKYQVPQKSNVIIKVYNMLGQYITTLLNAEKSSGVYDVVFNTDNLAGGVYIYTLETESFRDTKKMILLK
jgi:N-acetylmuramoyl-L-alanine amidase